MPSLQPHPSDKTLWLATSQQTLARGIAITLLANTLIATGLWALGMGGWVEQMVYSQGIGLSIWALINTGARLLSHPTDRGGFPTGWRAALLVVGAVVIGVALGASLGNAYAQRPWRFMADHHPGQAWTLLGMTFVISMAMTLYFYLSGKSSYLQTELERAQRLATEAQLRLLQAQLEPHMLFNTLANLRVLMTLDARQAQTMLDHLIAFLRATLQASRATQHPLHTEFERVHDYLALMGVRMGARLATELHLPEALRELPVPPLVLQPLVENAIRHGLEPKVAGGMLQVSARREGASLVLTVADTGVGLQAHSPPAPAAGSGFGLEQVRERLAATYGPQASLTLRPQQANVEGTCAELRLPWPLQAPQTLPA
jgi:signal transduction histidine kinase